MVTPLVSIAYILRLKESHPFVAPSQRTRRSLQFLHAIRERFRFGFGAEDVADPPPPAAPR
jgi:hypothetical protein